jgi:hypothetical protein
MDEQPVGRSLIRPAHHSAPLEKRDLEVDPYFESSRLSQRLSALAVTTTLSPGFRKATLGVLPRILIKLEPEPLIQEWQS